MADPVDQCVEERADDGGRLVLGDHGRAADARSRREIRPPINVDFLEFTGMRVEDRPTRGRFWLARALASWCAKLAFRWGAHRDHPAENLDLDAWDRAAVEPAINGLEQLADGRSIGSREVAHRKLDRDLVALAAVAHEGGALLDQFGGGRAAPP